MTYPLSNVPTPFDSLIHCSLTPSAPLPPPSTHTYSRWEHQFGDLDRALAAADAAKVAAEGEAKKMREELAAQTDAAAAARIK
jgi:hypothetical protein